MDLVLNILDDWVLDRIYARLVPLSAFGSSPEIVSSLNSTTKFLSSSSSTWTQLISHLPRPTLTHEDVASLYTNAQSIPQISAWPRDYIPRQLISLCAITLVGIHLLYFLFAWLSYTFIFNHEMMRHPRFLKNQVKLEIQTSVRAFPGMMILTLPWFQAEVMGYTKLYDGLDTYGYFYLVFSVVFQISVVHRLLYLLATQMAAPTPHLQIYPQTAS